MRNSIAITGSGIICAIGKDKQQVRDSLLTGKTGIGELRYLPSRHKDLPVGEVKMSNEELKQALGVSPTEEYSRTALLGAYALHQTLIDARLTPESLKEKRVTFISGTTVGGTEESEQYSCGNNTKAIAQLTLFNFQCSMFNAEGVASELRERSGNVQCSTISTACSSALNAIILGSRMLLRDETDIVLAGGTEALSVFHLNGFNSLMILDHEVCRPFDATRQGLNLGEGAAYLVLERTNDARSREANIEAYIAGWGNRCDAFHQTATSDNGEGAFLAMTDALQMADLQPQEIDYINAHGTGTPDNDKAESAALHRVFADVLPPVSSTKSLTGHTTSASGSIETVICLIAMLGRFIPGNFGWKNKAPECITPTGFIPDTDLHHVLCNSFGFGGNDSSLILSDREPQNFSMFNVKCSMVNCAEATITQEEELKALREYMSPMESRRMCQLMKAAFLTSMRALEKAGINKPDAIIIATEHGMYDNGRKILETLIEKGEEGISPTLFMQSTHNTLAGALAIHLGCHGYNITYSQGKESLQWAIQDAQRLIQEGKAKNVLVGFHDEMPLYSKSIIIKKV